MTENDNERIIQIHTALFGVSGTDSKGLVGQFNEMYESVNTLPCDEHSRQIKKLDTWHTAHDKEISDLSKFKSQAGLKFWHGLILVVSAAVASGLATMVVNAVSK